MGVKWTVEQQKVIDTRNSNILVSAAAGSGKTAVLVERIITRLTKDTNPINIDELLIVTFTEAAAAEMKERILAAIENALYQNPDDEHLQRQISLIHNASITTIHSFCMSVIKSYFYTIDLDPVFRVGDEGELTLLKSEVVESLLEEEYQKVLDLKDEKESIDHNFLRFVESFATGKKDQNLEQIIESIYTYSRSYPMPEVWLESCLEVYKIKDLEELSTSKLGQAVIKDVKGRVQGAKELIDKALEIAREEDGPSPYLEALVVDELLINNMEEATTLEAYAKILRNYQWTTLSRKKGENVCPEKKEQVKFLRDNMKKSMQKLENEYFFKDMDEQLEDIKQSKTTMEEIIRLVKVFGAKYEQAKRKRNLIDFNDMEQYALRILTKENEGQLIPSPVAKELQEKFREVMIDEYQDSNFIQEALLTSVSKNHSMQYNMFMVGDVKQSIYRFRLSRPELFMEKFHTYTLGDGERCRIDLHKNFRSRAEVLDPTNHIFYKIMNANLGGVDYNKEAALYVGASFKEQSGNHMELRLLNDTSRELEAREVARRIKELVNIHPVIDKKTGDFRPAKYSDMVILTRSLAGWSDVFSEVLESEGIPVDVASRGGYFSTWEISLLMDYLRVIDNPRQDIPLTAVLSSMFGNITSEELATIQSSYPGKVFSDAVFEYKKQDTELSEKLKKCLDTINHFREENAYGSVYQLLKKILETTSYKQYVSALSMGEQRLANVEMLLEKATAFEETSYKGLFHFIRYVELLEKYKVEYGEAATGEAKDSIPIMSIHKSKGLEFPIVFVIGMGKNFNTADTKGEVVIHPELGLGIHHIDAKRRVKTNLLPRVLMNRQLKLDNLGEELRILYVAMTRAKEKLILTGALKDIEVSLEKIRLRGADMGTEISYDNMTQASTYLDWILPALCNTKGFDGVYNSLGLDINLLHPDRKIELPFEAEIVEVEELVAANVGEIEYMIQENISLESKLQNQNPEIQKHENDMDTQKDIKSHIIETMSYQYPYIQEQDFKTKVSVSELKEMAMGAKATKPRKAEPVVLVPEFMKEKETSESINVATERGNAYHRFMELWDYKLDTNPTSVEEYLENLIKKKVYPVEYKEYINPLDISFFLESKLGLQMKKAAMNGKLFREQPFVLGLKAEEIYGIDTDETTLLQGIIDVYFIENDQAYVVDFKTDQVKDISQLRERYASQLQYYGRAVEQLSRKKVAEKLIYSFVKKDTISITDE